MSVYSVTGITLSSAVHLALTVSLTHFVWYSKKSKEELINKDFIINIDVSSKMCLYTEFWGNSDHVTGAALE